jgi:tmRNA-binding protein
MARKLRVEYPGAIYHVMNRGKAQFGKREDLKRRESDREMKRAT